ncbi:helix-turn-helix domain-containing protein [Pseudolactococcus yaeyamensis]
MSENECGLSKVMTILGGKWQMPILWHISQHPNIRFNQLKREVDGITNIMLVRCLEKLLDFDLVKKTDFKTVPPHVEYALTDKGEALMPFLYDINTWRKEFNFNL